MSKKPWPYIVATIGICLLIIGIDFFLTNLNYAWEVAGAIAGTDLGIMLIVAGIMLITQVIEWE